MSPAAREPPGIRSTCRLRFSPSTRYSRSASTSRPPRRLNNWPPACFPKSGGTDGMVISFNGTKAPNIFSAPPAPEETSSESTGSFTDQMSSALGNQAADGSDVKVPKGQDSGARQILAAAADSSSPAPAAPATSAPAAAAVSNGTVSGEPLDDAARSKLIQAEIDAYWAGQPPAVQQLRNIGDFVQRMSMANQLASQGYSIDKSIMVWGYDPMKTMVTRQIYGYSWVPSLNQ